MWQFSTGVPKWPIGPKTPISITTLHCVMSQKSADPINVVWPHSYRLYSTLLCNTIHNSSCRLILNKVHDTNSFQVLQYTLGIKHLRKHHICPDIQPDMLEEKVEWLCDNVVVGPKKSKKVYIHSAGPALQHSLADPKKELKRRGFTPSGTKQRWQVLNEELWSKHATPNGSRWWILAVYCFRC